MSDTKERRAVAAPAPSKEASRPLREVQKLGELFNNAEFMKRLQQCVPKQMDPGRMLRTLVGSVQRSPLLMQCEIMDVAAKMLVCAQAGLETDTPLGHAYLIPFKNRVWNPATKKREEKYVCTVIFGYHGLLDLSFRSGMVGTVRARCVWQDEVDGGHFRFKYGTGQMLDHVPLGSRHDDSPEAQAQGAAENPVWVYAHATLKDGFSDPFEVLPWGEVESIRDKTPAYRAAQFALNDWKEKNNASGWLPPTWTEAPWVRYRSAMASKTAFRALSDWLPRTIEVANAIAVEDAMNSRPLDFGPIIDSTDYMAAAADVAGTTGDPAATFSMREGEGETAKGAGKTDAPDTKGISTADTPSTTEGEKVEKTEKPTRQRTTKAAAVTPKSLAEEEPPADRWGPPATTEPATAATLPGSAAVAEPSSDQGDRPGTLPASDDSGFDYWLLDVNGDVAGEAPHADPQKYAEALEVAWAASDNKERLLQENADGIEEAIKLDFRAAKIIRSLQEVATATPEPEPDYLVPVRIERGKPNDPQYLKDFKAAVKTLTPESLVPFLAANHMTLLKTTKSTRAVCIKEVSQRADELKVERPHILTEIMTGAPKEDPAAAYQRDADSVQQRIIELKACKSAFEVQQWAGGMVMKSFGARLRNEGKTDLIQQLEDAYSKRQAEIGGDASVAA